jgi:predicted alpha-1,2-mannosidase
MKRILIILFGAMLALAPQSAKSQDLVDLVNPRIGSISHVLMPTFPTVHRPYGMLRFWPVYSPGIIDTYLATRIYGFPLNRPEHRGGPAITIMPLKGKDALLFDDKSAEFDRDFETISPYYYSVILDESEMTVEFTPTEKAAFFAFKSSKTDDLVLYFQAPGDSELKLKGTQNVVGYATYRGVKQYVNIFFNHPVKESGYVTIDKQIKKSKSSKGDMINYYVVLDGSVQVLMNYGLSWIDDKQAGRNLLSENPGWKFAETVEKGRQAWNSELGKIQVSGGTLDQRVTFYTALYRSYERMVNINEGGRYYSAYDHKIHKTKHDFYVDDWSWDTYRSLHPLRTIIAPQREEDMIKSYILMGEQSGWMPTFPQIHGDAKCMIGHHQAAIIADAWAKGLRGFDKHRAYKGLRKNAFEGTMLPWKEGPATDLDDFYRMNGYFPALDPDETETNPNVHPYENRQSVAVTLEHAYDDWCLAQLAAEWGYYDDTASLFARSKNYKNVFNPEVGLMAPKKEDGSWVTPFNPKTSGGDGCRQYFAEVNSWNYSWSVQHDIDGLIDLMGGNELFIQKLDDLFSESLTGYAKWGTFQHQPDATGLTGQFVMGNEPGFHVPYLYTLAGKPWKTQKRVRQLMDAWFRNDVMGIAGDEDGGGLSSWYVFSAMGFYPVTPGKPEYVLGSPIFEEVRIDLGEGKEFVIKAPFASKQNKYIQSAKLNGEDMDSYLLPHKAISDGGTLILDMGSMK